MTTMPIREVLFPTDFSDVAYEAGRTAADLARQFNARLHVLNVVGPGRDPQPAPGTLQLAIDGLGGGLRTVAATVAGVPSREIVAYARDHGIDLIVMGTHGRTGVSRVLLGSVAEAVVRRSTCRVLTVPAKLETVDTQATSSVPDRCVVCTQIADELICERCRALIRGESLQRKRANERVG